jgi:hypothetical protein
VALAGNVDIKCSSLTPAQRKIIEGIPAILNKILANQLDTEAVMAKLDEMHKDIRQIRDSQGWPELTVEQMKSITDAAAQFPRRKMSIVVPNQERDTSYFSKQLAQALKADPANWDGQAQNIQAFAPPDAPIPLGIEFRVPYDNPAFEAVAGALGAIFGRSAVRGVRNTDVPIDRIDIWILYKPR